jgi:hypothetical protein
VFENSVLRREDGPKQEKEEHSLIRNIIIGLHALFTK